MNPEIKAATLRAIVQLQSNNAPTSLRNIAELLGLKSHNAVKVRLAKLEEERVITIHKSPGCPNQIYIR